MSLEISPEPTPEEREALVAALAALDGEPDRLSAWWEAGIRDAVADSEGGRFSSGEGPSGLSPED